MDIYSSIQKHNAGLGDLLDYTMPGIVANTYSAIMPSSSAPTQPGSTPGLFNWDFASGAAVNDPSPTAPTGAALVLQNAFLATHGLNYTVAQTAMQLFIYEFGARWREVIVASYNKIGRAAPMKDVLAALLQMYAVNHTQAVAAIESQTGILTAAHQQAADQAANAAAAAKAAADASAIEQLRQQQIADDQAKAVQAALDKKAKDDADAAAAAKALQDKIDAAASQAAADAKTKAMQAGYTDPAEIQRQIQAAVAAATQKAHDEAQVALTLAQSQPNYLLYGGIAAAAIIAVIALKK